MATSQKGRGTARNEYPVRELMSHESIVRLWEARRAAVRRTQTMPVYGHNTYKVRGQGN